MAANNRRGRYALVVFAVVLALIGLGGFGIMAATGATKPTANRYTTATVTKASVEETLALSGTVTRTGEEAVSFAGSGTVTSVKVKVGDRVGAGQVLATLDKAPFQVALLQAQAGLAKAEATLRTDQDSVREAAAATAKAKAAAAKAKKAAAKAAARTRAAMRALQAATKAVQDALAAQQQACSPVIGSGATPTPAQLSACSSALATLAQAEGKASQAIAAASAPSGGGGATASFSGGATVRAASDAQIATDKANVIAAQQRVTTATKNLQDAALIAPMDGTVGALSLVKGAASAGRSVTIVGAGKALVSVEVPLATRSLVSAKQAATVTPAGGSTVLTGTVTQVSMLATSGTSGTTASYTTTVTVADPEQLLHTGARAEVAVNLRQVTDVLTVPISAVTRITSTTATVKVLDAGSEATPQSVTVTTGALGGGRIEIVEGLREGQLVVLADRQATVPVGNIFGRRTTTSATPTAISSTEASAAPTQNPIPSASPTR